MSRDPPRGCPPLQKRAHGSERDARERRARRRACHRTRRNPPGTWRRYSRERGVVRRGRRSRPPSIRASLVRWSVETQERFDPRELARACEIVTRDMGRQSAVEGSQRRIGDTESVGERDGRRVWKCESHGGLGCPFDVAGGAMRTPDSRSGAYTVSPRPQIMACQP